LRRCGDASVVVGLIDEDDDGNEAEAGLDCVDAERDLPLLRGDDEGGYERPEIG
jgi:hypothetical protein